MKYLSWARNIYESYSIITDSYNAIMLEKEEKIAFLNISLKKKAITNDDFFL
jgi:hypothetical protein